MTCDEDFDEVADQVAALSRIVSEMALWMQEAETVGSVPPGLMERVHDLAHLDRIQARIDALRAALDLTESNDREALNKLLQDSLAEMVSEAEILRGKIR